MARNGAAGRVSLWSLAAVLAAGSVTGSAAGQSVPEEPPDYPQVEVELGGTLFKQVLPFDVPFFIFGSVPGGTRSVEVRYIEHDGFFRVELDEPTTDDSPRCFQPEDRRARRRSEVVENEVAFGCDWTPAEAQRPFFWSRFGDAAKPPASETFRIAVPPLRAKRYYIFRFDVLADPTPEALDAFRARARTIFDQQLAPVRDANFFTGTPGRPGDLETLRAALRNALGEVAGRARLQIDPESVFHIEIPWSELQWPDRQRFNQSLAEVVTAQQRIASNHQQRALDATDLAAELEALADDPDLAALLKALREAAAAASGAQSELLGELLDSQRDALALAALDTAQAERLARGGDPASDVPPPPLGVDTTDPAVARAAAAGYEATLLRLVGLQDLLARMLPGGRSRYLVEAQIDAGRITAEQAARLADTAARVELAVGSAGRLANSAEQIATNLSSRARALDTLTATVAVAAADVGILIQGNTLGSFKTQQKPYIAADFGMGMAPDLEKAVPYFGTNIYTRPVNKDAPLSSFGGFRRRFAFTLGLTVESIADENPQTRRDLFNSNALLLGAGLRVTDSARVGAGAILFEKEDPNPLVESWELTSSYYVTLSFDWDVLGFFKNFSSVFQ